MFCWIYLCYIIYIQILIRILIVDMLYPLHPIKSYDYPILETEYFK